jgi:hypothetical protein
MAFLKYNHCLGQDGDVGSARPLQQASSTGVKQIVLKLSGLRQSPASSGELPPVSYGGMSLLSSK